MYEHLKYVNHLNEVVEFGKGNILVNRNDFRDYEWNFATQYQKLSAFNKQPSKKNLPFLIFGANAKATANKVHEILEKDILAIVPGRLYSGEFYLRGYFYASSKSEYLRGDVFRGNLLFVTDQNFWIKEDKYVFRLSDEEIQGGHGYDYGYPYDYSSSVNVQNLYNTGFMDTNFEMVVYGPVTNPILTVSGHSYAVEVDLLANEYLTINSADKTIIRTTARGEKVNEFSHRNLENYVFQKMPAGVNRVVTNAPFNYDITLLLERSEPLWI